MKRTLLKLACAGCLLVLPFVLPGPAAAEKCASCSELLKSCKAFCGGSVVFNCQNSNPCAGTCTCG